MERNEIENKVIASVAASMARPESEINLRTRIMSDLGADSLDFMDIIFQLEEKVGLRLEKSDFDFLKRTGLSRDNAVENDLLTAEAKSRLAPWLPGLDPAAKLAPKDLADYVSVESLVLVVVEKFR